MHRQMKTDAQIFHQLNRFQTFFSVCAERGIGLREQIGIGLMVRAADPPAQLMQLGQAKLIGAIHDDGVSTGHVNSGFNNRGTQQHVKTLVVKVAHHMLQLTFAHLAMGDADARLRQKLLQFFQHVLDSVDFVVQEINLAAALQFAQYRFAD